MIRWNFSCKGRRETAPHVRRFVSQGTPIYLMERDRDAAKSIKREQKKKSTHSKIENKNKTRKHVSSALQLHQTTMTYGFVSAFRFVPADRLDETGFATMRTSDQATEAKRGGRRRRTGGRGGEP